MNKYHINKFAHVYDQYHHSHFNIINQLCEFIKLNNKQNNIIDIGCGTGNETLKIYEITSSNVVGLDPSNAMLTIARKKSPDIKWINGCAEKIPLADSSFDAITLFFSYHHIKNIDKAIKEFDRILRPKGHIAIVTINHQQMKNSYEYKLFPELYRYDSKRVPSVQSIRNLFKKHGFTSRTVNTLYENRKIDQRYLEMVRDKYRSGLYNFNDSKIAQAIEILISDITENKNIVDSIFCTIVLAHRKIIRNKLNCFAK